MIELTPLECAIGTISTLSIGHKDSWVLIFRLFGFFCYVVGLALAHWIWP